MTDIKLDDIPDLVKAKKITPAKACMEVYLTLYMEPARFNLQDMDEDSRSDFLLQFIQKRAHTLLENYNPSISPFGAYIYSSIQTMKITFCKKLSDKKNYNEVFFQDSIYDYQDKMDSNMQKVTEVAEREKTYSSSSTCKKEIPQLVYRRLFNRENKRLSIADSQKRKIERGVLILALKSAWYISDTQIDKVSKICNIPSEVISSSICKLKAGLITKALCRQEIENNRNRAYSFVSNYRLQMQAQEDNKESLKFEQIKKKHDFQKNSWLSKTAKLQKGRFKIAPSNTEIADLLGITGRLISCYIKNVKDMKSSEFEELNLS